MWGRMHENDGRKKDQKKEETKRKELCEEDVEERR